MDRVLLIIDDIQFSAHLETTLRKVGFDVENTASEFQVPEKLISFNPDYIIVKGSTPRLSTDNVGKKLKESTRFLGKVILVFPKDQKSNPDELIKLRMDVLLFEPVSALRLASSLLSLTQLDKDTIFDKLMRLAQTDSQFRNDEAEILKGTGLTVDSEINTISSKKVSPDGLTEQVSASSSGKGMVLNDEDILNFIKPGSSGALKEEPAPAPLGVDSNYSVDSNYQQNLKEELAAVESQLPLRIESYNQAIKDIDQDLKAGHKKRETRTVNVELFSSFGENKDESKKAQEEIDKERRQFVKALLKK